MSSIRILMPRSPSPKNRYTIHCPLCWPHFIDCWRRRESLIQKKVKEGSPGNHDVGYICVKAISEWRGLGRVKEIMSHIHHSPNPAATHTHAHTQTHTHTHTPLHVHLETNENCYRLLIMSSLRKFIGSYFFWKVNNLGNAKIIQN